MKTINITDIQHKKLQELASKESTRRGKFISLQDIIEISIDFGLAEIIRMKYDVDKMNEDDATGMTIDEVMK